MDNIVPLLGVEQASIPLDMIIEDPFLPRKSYSQDGLAQLAEAIVEQKLMHAIVVTRRPDGFFALIFGSRRVRAARAVGFTHIPGTIADIENPRDILILALAENVQREDLDPIEEANGYLLLCQEYEMTIEVVARRIGKSSAHVRSRIKLLDLAPEVQQLIVDEKLAPTAAVTLVGISSGEEQVELARLIVRDRLSPHEARSLVREEDSRSVGLRGRSREMTVQKYRLSIVNFCEQVKRSFANIEKLSMTAEERGRVMKAHLELELISRGVRDRLSAGGKVKLLSGDSAQKKGNVPSARNHGAEWPAGHVKLLSDRGLSDEDVASQIGRELSAVKSMRKELRSKKR